MPLKRTGLVLLLASCAEQQPLQLDSISETIDQLHFQSEAKIRELEEHLENVSLLTEKMQDYGDQSGSRSIVYYLSFEDKAHYQWETIYQNGDLSFDFSHRIEHDFSKPPRYGIDTTYRIIDVNSNGQEDSAKMIIWKGEFAMFCKDINNGEYPLCGDELLEDLDLNHLPPGCKVTDGPTCSAEGTNYYFQKNPYISAMYRSLVRTTLQRLDGKNDAALDIEFIDAWEQLKINEPRLLKDCR